MAEKTDEGRMSYAEMQDFFERTLKLETPPVAIKFVKIGADKPKGVSTNIKAMSFCQAVTVARQGNYSVYLTRETCSCPNARMACGLGNEEQIQADRANQISKYHKYAPNAEAWEKVVDKKYAIPPGVVAGIAVAPLARAKFEPDCLMFTVVPWQAYYLTNGYMFATGDAPVTFTTATNSLVCGYGAALPAMEKKINMCTACTGGRSYAGTESIHVYWTLPWDLIDVEIEGLKGRAKVAPYPGLVTIPGGVPKPDKHFFKDDC